MNLFVILITLLLTIVFQIIICDVHLMICKCYIEMHYISFINFFILCIVGKICKHAIEMDLNLPKVYCS